MRSLIWRGGAILLLAVFIAGCASQEDKLVEEQIATLDKLTAVYATVVDKQSYDAAESEIGTLRGKMGALEKQLTELGSERKESALKKHASELDVARTRYKSARDKAAETAWGVKPRQ